VFDPEALLGRLIDEAVEFVVIGGVAVAFHGVIRATKDLDICPEPSPGNYARLASLLLALDVAQAGSDEFAAAEFPHDPTDPAQLAQGGNFQLTTALGALDVMQWVPGIDSDHAHPFLSPDAIEVAWRGRPLQICSLEHLRLMKRTAGRAQDLQDLRDLAIVHGEA